MGVLILLATILFVGAVIAASIFFVIFGKPSLLKYVAGACLVWFAAYALVLVGVSLSSNEKELAAGEPKRYCGFYLDCHMAAQVNSVMREKVYKGHTAKGIFWIVDIEVSSDARRAELRLISPQFQIIDSAQNRYDLTQALSTPVSEFEKRIGPDEKINGEVVFDIPESVKNPRLNISMVDPIDLAFESILIGDEDSFLHKRTYFVIEGGETKANL